VEVAIVPPFTTVQPEKLDAYEIGAKTAFLNAVKGTFDVAIFYNDFYNQQLQLNFNPIPGTGLPATAVPVNAGKSRLWGVEVGLNVSPFKGLLINVDYTYLDTRILSFPDFTTLGGNLYQISSQYLPGDSLPLSPRNKAVVGVNYTLPLSDTIGKISFGASFSYASRQSVAPGDRTVASPAIQSFAQLGATDLLDLNATWKSVAGGPIDLSVFGTNVTNFKYYTFVQQTGTDGAEFATVGPPAMFGVRARYNFGVH
jgi:iron complex outermembrane receptor protein